MARVDLEHVEKIYPNGTRGVVDLSLEIADGELVVLVGPSGCGKSTLLRMVAGLETITGGTLRIGDRVANGLSPQERNVAMVFQDYALYPQMTVRGNLEFPLRMRRLARPEIDRRVRWAAEVLGLEKVLTQLPKQLSGGQRQRVAMGRALVREPAVFLMDEPLSNLDAKLRVQVRAEIGDLQRRLATTMLYVTHDQVEAMTLGHRVAVLNAGRLEQVDTPAGLYDRPATAFVAGFIGNPPMNVVPTHVTADAEGGAVAAVGDQTWTLPKASADFVRATRAGVRPEALRPTDGPGGIRTTVEHAEWLGHETLAYVRVGAEGAPDAVTLVARLPGMQELHPGAPLTLTADPTSVYLFDGEGRALR